MYPSRLEIKRWAVFWGESSTKCDNSRDRETTVFIVIINKLIGQIKNIYYSNPSCRKSFQDRQCNAVHEPLLNIAGISLFYTTQNAKMLHGLERGGALCSTAARFCFFSFLQQSQNNSSFMKSM